MPAGPEPSPDEPIDPDLTPASRRGELALTVAVVAIGGVLGALARYAIGLGLPAPRGTFPTGTLLINASGCLVIGCFLVVVTEFRTVHHLVRPFFGTGVLGGFTTFSTYCADIEGLISAHRPGTALVYLAATALLALLAVTLSATGTRRLLRRTGRSER